MCMQKPFLKKPHTFDHASLIYLYLDESMVKPVHAGPLVFLLQNNNNKTPGFNLIQVSPQKTQHVIIALVNV